jgi:hypothetical protein
MRKLLAPVLLVALAATAVIAVNAIGATGTSATATQTWARALATHASPASAAASQAAANAERIVLRDVTAREKFIDADDNGRESVGDYVVVLDRLLSQGTQVGALSGTCSAGFDTFACDVTIRLFNRGSLEVSGVFTRRHALFAITGGTGEFIDAGGELTVGSGQQIVLHVLHLAEHH